MTGVGQRVCVPCSASQWHVVCIQNTSQNAKLVNTAIVQARSDSD